MPCNRRIMVPRPYGSLSIDNKSYIEVPCGKCLGCKRDRTKAWAIRLMLESLSYKDSAFVTLTYDDDNIPLVPLEDYRNAHCVNLPYTLHKPDLQKFFKRLRRDLDEQGRKIRYYAVGEYGETTFRPHYHFIVFGLSSMDKQLIEDNWSKGLVDIGDVTLASCNYVAGYVQKKLYGDVADSVYELRTKPFSCMSKGIGKDYLMLHWQELVKQGFLRYRGAKIPLSRYFWEQVIKSPDIPLDKIQVKMIRHDYAQRYKDKEDRYFENIGVDDVLRFRLLTEQDQAREESLRARAELYKRGNL